MWDLARLYNEAGRKTEAFARIKQLASMAPTLEEKAKCFLNMGRLMEQMHDFEMAIKYYSTALSLEPINNETWYFIYNNLGFSLNQLQRYAEAESYCRQAIQIEPQRHNAYKNLGVAMEGQSDYFAAAKCFIQSVQTNAADPRALKHLEQLAEKHPTVTVDMVNFESQLEICRTAVAKRLGLTG